MSQTIIHKSQREIGLNLESQGNNTPQEYKGEMDWNLNENRSLIKIHNWNTDMLFEEEQIMFLKIFQKQFLDLDIWNTNLHEVILYMIID